MSPYRPVLNASHCSSAYLRRVAWQRTDRLVFVRLAVLITAVLTTPLSNA